MGVHDLLLDKDRIWDLKTFMHSLPKMKIVMYCKGRKQEEDGQQRK